MNMPDVEYAALIEDLSETINIYRKTFFSMAHKMMVFASTLNQKSQADM